MELNEHINPNSKILDIMAHPAFEGKGKLLFPWDEMNRYNSGMTMRDAPRMHLWHNNMDVNEMVAGVNRMIDDKNSGKRVFFDIYTPEEKQADPSKNDVGLFYFKGQTNAPFAVICPGGGFCYVGSLHEGFPVAMEINKLGYNAFVLKYRTNGRKKDICEDLTTAVRFIQSHTDELDVCAKNYSLWGGSAGARLCSYVTYLGANLLSPQEMLHPAANIIAYTYFDFNPRFTSKDPPGFFIVGTHDWLVPVRSTLRDANGLKQAGVNMEMHVPKNAQHGFGVGKGTSAEGWIQKAVDFWERNMK